MKGILHSICIGSLALALTVQGQQVNDTTNVKTKKARATATTSAQTGATVRGSTRVRAHRDMATARVRQHANVSARTNASATVTRNRARNMSTNARVRARNDLAVNRQRERNIAMTERVKNQRNKTNVHVNVNDRTRFTNVTRVTSGGRTFNRAVFRDRDDRHFRMGFHDRAFFVENFSEVVVINGCSFFLDEGIFWPAFIIGENCVHPRNVVFVAVG
jgi:hypothetical protein